MQPHTYINAVYAHIEHWYEIADRKAQVVLVLDGIFLSFITSQAFTKAEDLAVIIKCSGPVTLSLLFLMVIFLAASILSAIGCLHPRLHAKSDQARELRKEARKGPTAPIPAKFSWYFGYLAQLNQDRVANQLMKVDGSFADEALAHEAAKFSRNVYRKHIWVDRAFLFAGLSLICLLIAAAFYWWSFDACKFICTNGT